MRLLRQNPYHVIAPNETNYVETFKLDDQGNPTDELDNYIKYEEGVFAIDTVKHPEYTLYEGNGVYSSFAGVKTYCYQWPDMEAYELDFPPVVEEIVEPTQQPEVPAYDLDAGKAQAQVALKASYNKRSLAITSEYPEREVLTWPTKLEEALRFKSGEGSEYIEGIASKVGVTADEFAEKVLTNNEAYQEAIIALEAFRMMTSRAIESAQDEQDINAILEVL